MSSHDLALIIGVDSNAHSPVGCVRIGHHNDGKDVGGVGSGDASHKLVAEAPWVVNVAGVLGNNLGFQVDAGGDDRPSNSLVYVGDAGPGLASIILPDDKTIINFYVCKSPFAVVVEPYPVISELLPVVDVAEIVDNCGPLIERVQNDYDVPRRVPESVELRRDIGHHIFDISKCRKSLVKFLLDDCNVILGQIAIGLPGLVRISERKEKRNKQHGQGEFCHSILSLYNSNQNCNFFYYDVD